MSAAILEQLQRLPEPVQQEALRYLEALVAQYAHVSSDLGNEKVGQEHPAAKFYGCLQDDTFQRQPQV